VAHYVIHDIYTYASIHVDQIWLNHTVLLQGNIHNQDNLMHYSINSCFIGGGNKSTWRKPQVTDNFITQYCNGYTSSWAGFELTTLVVIDTDCTGSCKSNYHTITTITASCQDQVTSAWMQWQACQKIHMLWLWPAVVNWFPVNLLINKTNNCLSIEENQYDDSYSINYVELVEWRLWCLTPLSTIFWLYRGCQFY
jgi:hypothetical protein